MKSNGVTDSKQVESIEQKSDSGEVLAEESQSLCPECRTVIDCQIYFRDNKVYMHKACEEHGAFEDMIYSDAEDYVDARRYNKPGASPAHRQGVTERGCPDDCGLCPEHKQHTCVGVIEITDRCNLSCPVCFAQTDASFSLPLEKVKEMIDLFVKCEEKPEVLQISGGEPTVHPDIFEILKYVDEKGIQYPLLNSNGIKLADREFARKISETMKPDSFVGKPVVYLQFDGLTDETYTALRGKPLLEKKMKAIENCTEFGMNITLVPTIVKGVNDHEIGDIVKFALNHHNIRMVNFQPGALVGRYNIGKTSEERMTIPELLEKMESQTEGLVKKPSFINIPCPYPVCSVCTYVYKQDDFVFAFTDFMDVEEYIEGFLNRTMPDMDLVPEVHEALDALFSMSTIMGSEKTEDALCTSCGLKVPNVKEMLDNITIISIHHFMDEYNFDLKRAQKCCVTEILPNGKMIPFCVYNNLRRKGLKTEFGDL
jgi:uncharacterized radical SAM superfamily Fe-S cluster-containing enzyme